MNITDNISMRVLSFIVVFIVVFIVGFIVVGTDKIRITLTSLSTELIKTSSLT